MPAQRFSRVKVTPAIAQKWLKEKNYADNRPISKSWVDYLARQMEKGLWQENGEPLIFDLDDQLLDGQHRLAAIVKSGITITFDIRRGVATESFTTIDQGRGRTAGQVFGMLGIKNSRAAASVCRLVYNWETTGAPFVGRRISPDEINLVWEVYEQEITSALEMAIPLKKSVPAPASILGFCAFLFAKASKKKASAFFATLGGGVAEDARDPALVLRNRLFREAVANSRRSLPKKAMFGLIIRGWNAYHKGDKVRQLQIKPDGDGGFKIPIIRGLGRSQGNKGGPTAKARGNKPAIHVSAKKPK